MFDSRRATIPLACVVIAALALFLNTRVPLFCDQSWFITFAEKVLDGARPYIDVADPNFPGAWLIYMPAVLFARSTGITPEVATLLQTLALVFVCLAYTHRLLRAADMACGLSTPFATIAVVFAFCLTWGVMIAQREHVAALTFLPLLAAAAIRASAKNVPTSDALLTGALCAVAIAIKPTHALVPLACAAYVCISRRDLRLALAPEYLVAASITLCGLGAMTLWTPAFFTDEWPQISATYALTRLPFARLVLDPRLNIAIAILATAFAVAPVRRDPRLLALATGAIAFIASACIQGKMPGNHLLPAVCYALTALALAVAARPTEAHPMLLRRVLMPVVVLSPLCGSVQAYYDGMPHAGLGETIARLTPPRPTIGGLNYLTQGSFPAVRVAQGQWVNAENSIWAPDHAEAIRILRLVTPAQSAALDATVAFQRKRLAAELAHHRPDVIITDDAETRIVETSSPELAHALDDYKLAAHVGEMEIWLRADLARRAAAR